MNRRLFDRLRLQRLVLDGDVPTGGTPKQPPLFINPTEPPSASTAGIKGALFFDDDLNALMQHNGSAFEKVGSSVTGISGALAVTGTLSGPRPVYKTTQILTAADSGAHCIFSVATVTTYTLPAAAAGLHFKFSCSATAAGTLDIFRVVCASGDFFVGTFIQSTDSTYTSAAHDANGSTHLAWQGNGGTTGGLKGDWLEVTASNGTLWEVFGMGRATGSEASPFATS